MSVDVISFGCRLNIYESEVMRDLATKAGHGNLVIINSCAVTQEASRQARQTIRRLKRERPDTRIVITGCAAQIEPERFAEMDEVSFVMGNHDKMQAQTWLALDQSEKCQVNDIMMVKETAHHLIGGMEGYTRAFVQVQNGCDHRCTFCIIPYGRGNSRSVPMGVIIDQIKGLMDTGTREIVLTGVDMTSYGRDLPGEPRLGTLVKALLKHVPDLPRLRLSSIDSIEADNDLMEALSDRRVMPHLHLSLQAGDNLILKRMKRRHLREDAIRFCEDARTLRPDLVFGADLIAGFPTETEEMFQRSLDLVDECGLTYLHSFPFSPRSGTPAAKMPQLARDIVKERAKCLRDKGKQALEAYYQAQVGQTHTILTEKGNTGRTESFAPVLFSQDVEQGIILTLPIKGWREKGLIV